MDVTYLYITVAGTIQIYEDTG